jgi:hypothetical protein
MTIQFLELVYYIRNFVLREEPEIRSVTQLLESSG